MVKYKCNQDEIKNLINKTIKLNIQDNKKNSYILF